MTGMIKDKKIDYQKTLFLPKTDFPMRASLPEKEVALLNRWKETSLYERLRESGKGRPAYILHDGPPYANGDIHVGHALNKVLKDIIVRSFQMRGYDSDYVPGWDCHGLPIEWKIEEKYRGQGKERKDIETLEFRKECRNFAHHWINVQSEQFQRLGVIGNFKNPYTTMNYKAEACIANELLKFAMTDQIYRGSKPVMWSVVERTALAEAEVEHREYESDVVWVQFPVHPLSAQEDLHKAYVVIWTTTPWTLPANRAVAFSSGISYGLYEVSAAEKEFGARVGDRFLLAERLAEEAARKAHLQLKRLRSVSSKELDNMTLSHPFRGLAGGYDYDIPMLEGAHVTDDAGSGFVHTAPGHGREDFELWKSAEPILMRRGVSVDLAFMVDDSGFLTQDAPGFCSQHPAGAARVINDQGEKGDANKRVIEELIQRNLLFARGRLKHPYPHSWRSGKPVIFRNTPQWFIHMDKRLDDNQTLRDRALAAIAQTEFIPESGKTRLQAMVSERPDWVISRQRIWGVPIPLFINEEGKFLKDPVVNERIIAAFENQGGDVWFQKNAKENFLRNDHDTECWMQVNDILDVWFDSGTTHSFVLKGTGSLKWPADVYLEGSDQHRGWFQSSLLESCGTRGVAPYKTVITHGFTLDEQGHKMSKSRGNTISPQDIIERSGADIFRLWVASVDYHEDQRLGDNVLKTCMDSYRKIRNTLRWMLGIVSYDTGEDIIYKTMPELERFMLHRLFELDHRVRSAYDSFDFKRITKLLTDFIVLELSSFYCDIRKDALYCDAPSSVRRKSSLKTINHLLKCLEIWFAPILPFTMEEAWMEHKGATESIHLEQFPSIPSEWQDVILCEKWNRIKRVRRVITAALEIARAQKHIGSSLEAFACLYIADLELYETIKDVDFAEIAIISGIKITQEVLPPSAFSLPEIEGVAVSIDLAEGKKCARSWRYTQDVGADPEFPDVSARDAAALHELKAYLDMESILK